MIERKQTYFSHVISMMSSDSARDSGLPFAWSGDRIRLLRDMKLPRNGDIMEALSNFFEGINGFLGVQGPGDLLMHPVFIGLCVAGFIAALLMRMKFMALAIAALVGGALVFHYTYPESSADLTGLIKFLVSMGALALVLIYLGFIRD
jgi:hypothetical protein